MILSILTAGVPSRFDQIQILQESIDRQIGNLAVEHCIFIDNKRRTVGEKRDALLRLAKGKYITYVDDDDDISDDYVVSILAAASCNPDVITFRQKAIYNGLESEVEFRLGHPNDQFNPNGITRRNAWHVCAWRNSLAIISHFPATNYGEDWAFASKLCGLQGLKSFHIPKVLHFYRHDSELTEAPPPLTASQN